MPVDPSDFDARAVSPLDIRFADRRAPVRRNQLCPVCGARSDATEVLEVPALAPPHVDLTLLHCAQCSSVHFDPPGIRDFSDLGATRDGFWRFYAEAAGGIWETIWPLVAVSDRGSLLDIGCGFGFALDFWHKADRGDAVGVELAEYGAAGARELGLTIHREPLEHSSALAGRRFDLVYASEVVEHVEEPRAFCALLAQFVADDGVLVMTTPAAEYITAANHGVTLLTALAPGFHGFLLSANEFERVLRGTGFDHVEVRRFNERLVAWASRRPLSVNVDEARLRAAYFDYMKTRVETFAPSSPVGLGYGYRLLRDWCNTGRVQEARALERRMHAAIESAYGAQALDPATAIAHYEAARTLDDIGRIGPYFLSCYFHFSATLAQHVDRDYARALGLYRAAAATARAAARVGVVHLPEATTVYWPARIGGATLALALGDDSGADVLAELADEGRGLRAEHAFGMASREQIEALLPPVAEELVARNRWPAATIVAEAYSRYVASTYGTEATSLAALGLQADEASRPLPADPLFVPFFAALVRKRESGENGGLIDFVHVAESISGRHAVRAGALAQKARQAAGMPPATPRFAFEMSFTLKPGSR